MTNIINFNKKDLTKLLKTYKKNDKKKFIEMIKNPNNDFNEILNKFKNKKNLEKNCNEVCLFNKIEESYNKYFFEKNRNKILNNYFSIVKKTNSC